MLQSRKTGRWKPSPVRLYFSFLLFLFCRMQSHPNFYFIGKALCNSVSKSATAIRVPIIIGWAVCWSEISIWEVHDARTRSRAPVSVLRSGNKYRSCTGLIPKQEGFSLLPSGVCSRLNWAQLMLPLASASARLHLTDSSSNLTDGDAPLKLVSVCVCVSRNAARGCLLK